jgi:hypothetical protein
MWLTRALGHGYRAARRRLAALEATMTAAEIIAARRLEREGTEDEEE